MTLNIDRGNCLGFFKIEARHSPPRHLTYSSTARVVCAPHPDVVFPPLILSALSRFPFHRALKDGFGQTWWTGDMTIPPQFASLYDGQEAFAWSDCLLDLGTVFLVGNMFFVWDAWYLSVAPHFQWLVVFFEALLRTCPSVKRHDYASHVHECSDHTQFQIG